MCQYPIDNKDLGIQLFAVKLFMSHTYSEVTRINKTTEETFHMPFIILSKIGLPTYEVDKDITTMKKEYICICIYITIFLFY